MTSTDQQDRGNTRNYTCLFLIGGIFVSIFVLAIGFAVVVVFLGSSGSAPRNQPPVPVGIEDVPVPSTPPIEKGLNLPEGVTPVYSNLEHGGRVEKTTFGNGRIVYERAWYDDGTPMFRRTLFDSKLEGVCLVWFEGKLLCSGVYHNGAPHEGTFLWYRDNWSWPLLGSDIRPVVVEYHQGKALNREWQGVKKIIEPSLDVASEVAPASAPDATPDAAPDTTPDTTPSPTTGEDDGRIP